MASIDHAHGPQLDGDSDDNTCSGVRSFRSRGFTRDLAGVDVVIPGTACDRKLRPHRAYHEQLGYDGDMLTRYVLVGLVLAGCGKPDAAKQQGAPAPAGILGSAAAPAPAGTPDPPVASAPPPAAEPPRAGSNAPKDEPVRVSTSAEQDEMERAIAPYIEQARKAYPDAKKRYLAGLPAGQRFSVVTKLHSPGRVEAVFVTVTGIKGDQVTGRIDSDVRGVAGYKAGDSYTLSERDIVDWVIVRPDGSEEGNLVGKFVEERNAKQHK